MQPVAFLGVHHRKIRKDLEDAKSFREEAEQKLKAYKDLIESAKLDAKKILSESSQKLNEDIQVKKNKIQKEIEQETRNSEKEIEKFKSESLEKINIISEEIVSNLIKDIFGEDLNKSSIKATVSQIHKEHKVKKI